MDPAALPPLGVLFGLVMLVVAWQVARRHVQRRFAFRDALRRPGETALVVAGSLLGTALITGSFIVGDTLDASYERTAYTQLGPVDESVSVTDPGKAPDVEERLASIDDPRIEDVMSMVAARAPVASGGSGKELAEPTAQVIELDFERARGFGGDPEITGIEGPTPEPGEAVVTEDLAETLNVSAGEHVAAYVYGTRLDLEVARILPAEGLAGYETLLFETSSPNAFVAPGTIGRAARDLPKGAVPPATTFLVSNRGGVIEGGELTSDVVPLLEDALAAEGGSLRVETLKADLLEWADEQGAAFSEIFLAIGAFAIVAGVLLLVNIFVMLSEERKGQLGMLRAVGMRRADLVRVFVIEGAIYSLVAGVLGAILGIGVGWAIVALAAPIFGTGDFSLDLRFAMGYPSIVGGFLLGVLIAMATVFFTSIRISRVNIIRAIRDITEPPPREPRKLVVVLGAAVAAGIAVLFVGALGDQRQWMVAILGPPLVLFSLVPLMGRFTSRRIAVIVASGLSLLWGIFGNQILDEQFFEGGDIFAFVTQGILLTFSAVVMLSQIAENFEEGIRRVAARYLSLRLSIAYPIARRFRTGLTLGMYSLVIFTMVMIAVFSDLFGGQVESSTKQEAAGYDVLASASETNPPSPDSIATVDGVERVSTMLYGTALFHPKSLGEPQPWWISGIDSGFVEGGGYELTERAPGLDTDADVYSRLLEDPETVVIDGAFLATGGGPPGAVVGVGESMAVINPVSGEAVTRKIIGVSTAGTAAFTGTGVLMSQDSVREVLGEHAAPSRFYIETADGADPNEVAANLQGEFVRNGVEADSFRALVEESANASVQFLRIMEGYLALGLLVGIAGLGVVMVRAVRERRRVIGVLRSLGFLPPAVRQAFLLESGFVAIQGIVIGSVLALVTASQLVAAGEFGEELDFRVPWFSLLVLCGSAFVASLIATAWPAQQASNIPPAVALRIAD